MLIDAQDRVLALIAFFIPTWLTKNWNFFLKDKSTKVFFGKEKEQKEKKQKEEENFNS